MPYSDPEVRKAYHKEYSREWFRGQSGEHKTSRSAARKAAQCRWLEKNPLYSGQYYAVNKAALRDRRLKRLYGISAAEYDAMFDAQRGRCAICGTDKPGAKRQNFAVDHCHGSGKVRGLLCIKCNTYLGWTERHGAKADEYLGASK